MARPTLNEQDTIALKTIIKVKPLKPSGKFVIIIFLALASMLGGCSLINQGQGGKRKEKQRVTYVVKPINRNRYYKPGKDRRTRRVKRVRLKDPKPKTAKKKTTKPAEDDSAQPDPDSFPVEEADSLLPHLPIF